MPIVPCLVNQITPGPSVVNLDEAFPFVMWDMVWKKMTSLLTHTVTVKLFGQHMQIIS